MAATAEAARLTEAHRLAQSGLAAQTVRQMLAVWPLLRFDDLDGTFDRWLRVVIPVVRAGRGTSARLAGNYLATFRAVELGVDVAPAVPVLADDVNVEQLSTSMLVTGPVAIRNGFARGRPAARVVTDARVGSARAATRHVLGGGRDTIIRSVAADRAGLGWARATSGKPCAFCAMLASRGPAYKSKQTATFRPHDGCHCSPEPVYRRDADWPAGARQFRSLWDDATAGASGGPASGEGGGDAFNAFRRALSKEGSGAD